MVNRVLLIQIRQSEIVKKEELESFSLYSKIPVHNFSVLDVFSTPDFDKSEVEGYDAIFIGGASEASVLEPVKYKFVPAIIEAIKHTIALEIPVFASCFGFQVAVLALGGDIIRDETDFEMGTYNLKTTEAAKKDLLFAPLPERFYAVSVHQERALDLPESCELLAYTDSCPHAFKVKGKPFWAFQFHPELDVTCLTQRLGVYQSKYTANASHYQKVIESLKPTEYANQLVESFCTNVLNRNKEIL